MDKVEFLKTALIPQLKTIHLDTKPLWGLMNVQQMVEHLCYFVRLASGREIESEIVTPLEKLEAFRDFIMSDIPFKENTKNKTLTDTPNQIKHNSLELAIDVLEQEIKYFFDFFEKNPAVTTRHAIFGDLNFDQWIALSYKHGTHHLRQFGIDVA